MDGADRVFADMGLCQWHLNVLARERGALRLVDGRVLRATDYARAMEHRHAR